MLRTTAIVLLCVCTLNAEVYRSAQRRLNLNRRNMYSPELLRILNNNDNGNNQNLNQFTPSLLKWANITDMLGNAYDTLPVNPNEGPVNSDVLNAHMLQFMFPKETTTSGYPNNYQDLSKYPIRVPHFPKYPSDGNGQDNDLITPQYSNPIEDIYKPDYFPNKPQDISPIYSIASSYPNIPQYPEIPVIPTLKTPTPPSPVPSPPSFPSNVIYPYDPRADYTSPSSKAPKYYESLKDLDQVTKEVRSNIQDPRSKNIDPIRYTAIVSVIDGMIKIMSHGLWHYYEQDYNARVPGFINFAINSPAQVKNQIKCVYQEANQGISKVRKLITENQWIQLVCNVSPENCNLVIQSLVKAGNEELKRDARLLIALGNVSRLYLDDFSEMLNREAKVAEHPSNLYMFLMSAGDTLKPLIHAGSEARQLFPRSHNCYN